MVVEDRKVRVFYFGFILGFELRKEVLGKGEKDVKWGCDVWLG